jgi:hypothetical protein
VRTEIE